MADKWTKDITGVDVSAHKTRHQKAGADEIEITGLKGFFHHGNIDGGDLNGCYEAMDNLDSDFDGGAL